MRCYESRHIFIVIRDKRNRIEWNENSKLSTWFGHVSASPSPYFCIQVYSSTYTYTHTHVHTLEDMYLIFLLFFIHHTPEKNINIWISINSWHSYVRTTRTFLVSSKFLAKANVYMDKEQGERDFIFSLPSFLQTKKP